MANLTETSALEEKDRIDLQQNYDCNSPSSCSRTTIHGLPNEILGLSLSLLGVGNFRYAHLACKMFLNAYLVSVRDEKMTTGKSTLPFRVRRNTLMRHKHMSIFSGTVS